MADQWTYDNLRRRWVTTLTNPTEPMPTSVPEGTAYGDWPRCSWPNGCTIGVREPRKLCSPHAELVLAYGHDPVAEPGTPGTPAWQRCRFCGVRGGMHGRLRDVDEAAAIVWLEDNPDVVLTPPPPSAGVERAQRVPDRINVHSEPTGPPPAMLPMEQVQRALDAGLPYDVQVAQVLEHVAGTPSTPPVSSPKVRHDAQPTAVEAARRAAPGAKTQRGRVLRCLVDAGVEGATDDQVSERLGMALNTVRPRRLELVEQGYAVDSGDTAPTPSGAQAIVWLATLQGVQAVDQ